jgi:uncharacterized RDD family membrane protein YckC
MPPPPVLGQAPVAGPGSWAMGSYDPAAIPLAAWGQRAAARIIDSLLESVISAPFILWILGPQLRAFVDSVPTDGSQVPPAALQAFVDDVVAATWSLTLVSVAVTFLYQVPQNVAWGQTLGKRVLGIRIRLLADDVNPRWPTAIVRWGTYTVGVLVLSSLFAIVDYLWPLWDKPWRQALHDKAARTIVVPHRKP